MFKFVLAALGLATVSSKFSYLWEPMEEPNNYFNFAALVTADAYYRTTYKGADSHESTGFKIDSYVNVLLNFEFFSWYMHTVTFNLVPLQFVPYQ